MLPERACRETAPQPRPTSAPFSPLSPSTNPPSPLLCTFFRTYRFCFLRQQRGVLTTLYRHPSKEGRLRPSFPQGSRDGKRAEGDHTPLRGGRREPDAAAETRSRPGARGGNAAGLDHDNEGVLLRRMERRYCPLAGGTPSAGPPNTHDGTILPTSMGGCPQRN